MGGDQCFVGESLVCLQNVMHLSTFCQDECWRLHSVVAALADAFEIACEAVRALAHFRHLLGWLCVRRLFANFTATLLGASHLSWSESAGQGLDRRT